jgi:hypothetical protein
MSHNLPARSAGIEGWVLTITGATSPNKRFSTGLLNSTTRNSQPTLMRQGTKPPEGGS